MKLIRLYNVFLACFEQAFQRVVCAMRLLGSMPSECMIHACPQGKHTRLSAYGQCSKRDRHSMPTKSRALTNYNAARLSHAAKRLSVAKSPVTRLSYVKAHAKRVKRFTMRAVVQSPKGEAALNVTILSEVMERLGCSDCLFEFYCDDKDKFCDLSVINFEDYEKI